jgi:hypothetical protein
MRSVADEFRRKTLSKMSRLNGWQRMMLAFTLGDADAKNFALSTGMTERQARILLNKSRCSGRISSVANASRAR